MSVFTNEFLGLMSEDERFAVQQLPASQILELLKPKIINQVQKGQQGEVWFEEMIKSKLPECQLVKTASTKWSGDFVLKRVVNSRTMTLMIDVKNYSNPVPRDEIVKFQRDMEVRKHDAGLLLSLNTKFVGHADDTDLNFTTVAVGGRDAPIALLTSKQDSVIVHCIRYLFSTLVVDRDITVNDVVVKAIKDVQQRLQQMGRLRYEIGLLQSSVNTSLLRLSNEILDIEVRTEALLDVIFANVDVKEYCATTLEDVESAVGGGLRTVTAKFIKLAQTPVQVASDRKTLKVGRAIVTFFATRDRVSIPVPVLRDVPEGDFTYKKDIITFDLEQNNLDLAVKLTTLEF